MCAHAYAVVSNWLPAQRARGLSSVGPFTAIRSTSSENGFETIRRQKRFNVCYDARGFRNKHVMMSRRGAVHARGVSHCRTSRLPARYGDDGLTSSLEDDRRPIYLPPFLLFFFIHYSSIVAALTPWCRLVRQRRAFERGR